MLVINKEQIGINKLNTYAKVQFIKEGMNTKRQIYTWDHLDNLYKKM